LMTMQEVALKVAPAGVLSEAQLLQLYTQVGAGFPTHPRKGRKPPAWFTWDPTRKHPHLQLFEDNTVAQGTHATWLGVRGTATLEQRQGVREWNVVLEQFDPTHAHSVAVGVLPADDTSF